jgi:hypothetical protein
VLIDASYGTNTAFRTGIGCLAGMGSADQYLHFDG